MDRDNVLLFIQRYLLASDEVREQVEKILTECQPQNVSQD